MRLSYLVPLFLAAAGCEPGETTVVSAERVDDDDTKDEDASEDDAEDAKDEDGKGGKDGKEGKDGNDPAEKTGEGGEATEENSQQNSKEDPKQDTSGKDDPLDPDDWGSDDEEQFAATRAEIYCLAAEACTPDYDCKPNPRLWMAGECRAYDPDKGATCIEAAIEMLDGLDENSEQEVCVAAMNPSECGKVTVPDWDDEECDDDNGEDGRPLRGTCDLTFASLTRGDIWSTIEAGDTVHPEAAAAWLRAARSEHASIASFSRLCLELMAHGASPELLDRCQQAARDEIAHARACLDRARELGAGPVDFGPMPIETRECPDLATMAIEALEDGCIGEGAAAVRARVTAERAHPRYRETLETIARDELRHAELAWASLGWMLRRDPSLGERLIGHLEQLRAGRSEAVIQRNPELEAYGVLDRGTRADIHANVLEQVVAPTLEALVAGTQAEVRVCA